MEMYFSKTHEWVKAEGDEAYIGITEFAASELGDITYVEAPKEGDDLIVGDVAATVESVKAASEVYSPISGTVCATNHQLEDDPDIISYSAEDRGWIYKLENLDPSELEELMDEEEYRKYLKTL